MIHNISEETRTKIQNAIIFEHSFPISSNVDFKFCIFYVIDEKSFMHKLYNCDLNGCDFRELETKENYSTFMNIENKNDALLNLKNDNRYIRKRCEEILK